MRQFLFLMAIVGLLTTGCAQSRVMGPHARRGGGNFNVAQSQSKSNGLLPRAFRSNKQNDVQLVGFRDRGGCDDTCCDEAGCGYADAECGYADEGYGEPGCGSCDVGCGCDEGCCDDGYCDAGCGCAAGGCTDGSCGLGGGGGVRGRLAGRMGGGACGPGGCGVGGGGAGGCSACGGAGCGLCQRVAGRVASGFCPHSNGYPADYNYNPSPPTGQVAYPYYTVRGPRDFLRNNPPSIGPY